MKRRKTKTKIVLHPVMSILLLIFGIIIVSFILSLFNFSASYGKINDVTFDYTYTTESVTNLLNWKGIKYVFANTVSNFANFTVLSNLIILLLGIGVMEYTGFLKTSVGLLTRHAKKNVITFVIILFCIISSIVGNMPFLAMIPLSALIFKYGKRNPNIGIIASFGALTSGYGLSILFTSVDSALSKITVMNAMVLDTTYTFKTFSLVLIMAVAVIGLAFLLTYITENIVAKNLPKYQFEPQEEFRADITKSQFKGLVLAGIGSVIFLLIVIYNIIPYLPLSGNFLKYSEVLYIDKLFGENAFFTDGFVFIITILFIIWGLLYGIGAKTIKNNREFIDSLGYSLNGVGKTLVFIFAGSTLISIFKQSNIGNVIVVWLANLISSSNFSGIALVLLLFVAAAISTIFVPNSTLGWGILASTAIPTFLSAGISAEFAQLTFRFGECVTLGITPIFAYFIVYLAYLEKYNQDKDYFGFKNAIKYQTPYAIATFVLLLVILILWYVLSIPLGFGGSVSL